VTIVKVAEDAKDFRKCKDVEVAEEAGCFKGVRMSELPRC
jgi:hypothetical protein